MGIFYTLKKSIFTVSFESKLMKTISSPVFIKDFNKDSDTLILIGPEGDFSPEEIDRALQNNFLPVTLGNTRLRTETAGIVAAVLLKNRL